MRRPSAMWFSREVLMLAHLTTSRQGRRARVLARFWVFVELAQRQMGKRVTSMVSSR
jgi:hypothetical protein